MRTNHPHPSLRRRIPTGYPRWRQRIASAGTARARGDRLVTRIDPGVVSPLTGLRGHGRRAAEDLGQWKTGVEERKPALLAGGDLLNAVCGSASPAPPSTRVLRSQ